MDELRDWIALHQVCWTRPETAWELVLRCGGVGPALHGRRDDLCPFLDTEWTAIEQLRATVDWQRTERDLAALHKKQVTVAPRGHPHYPPMLETISDPPLLLFWRGTIPDWTSFTGVAIVGSRKATAYGREVVDVLVAELLLRSLVTIISGLAFGIDAQAHRAALSNRGPTIAVLASGIDDITPYRHQKLGELIVQNGALCSEAPLDTPAYPAHFLSRNRIISGLARATIVVEAEIHSGSLVTARHAADQGREVFAVPGPITSPLSAGCNQLIKDGAIPFLGVTRCDGNSSSRATSEEAPSRGGTGGLPLSAVGPSGKTADERTGHPPVTGPRVEYIAAGKKDGHLKPLDDTTSRLFETLATGPCTANDLGERMGLPITKVLQLLTELECAGMLKVLPGGFVARN